MSIPSSSDDVATMAAQLAALQLVLDHHPLLAGERAVVGHHQRRAGRIVAGVTSLLVVELVELRREPLGGAAAVAEDDRRAVGEDAGEDLAGRCSARC